jgi:hypothetical protein
MRILIPKATPIVVACVLLAGGSVSSDIAPILESRYEYKMISSGKNRPAISLRKDNLGDILVLLHHRIPPLDIQSHFGWDSHEFERRIDVLLKNDFVRRQASGHLFPTSMVITFEDAETLEETARIVAKLASEMIANRVPEIKAYYKGLEPFHGIPFQDASLLILSDVVLDNWQINNVEQLFLKKERTLRHGMNYYHSLQEKGKETDKESFGIYGNQMWGHGKLTVGVYGNKRLTSRNVLTLNETDFRDLFGVQNGATITECRGRVLEALVRHAREPGYRLEPGFRRGFNVLGIMKGDNITIPILDRGDYEDLKSLAALVTSQLVSVLEDHRQLLQETYAESVYAEEITFEEYVIWWYHFFYSEVTDILIREGQMEIPRSGVATYVVDWS